MIVVMSVQVAVLEQAEEIQSYQTTQTINTMLTAVIVRALSRLEQPVQQKNGKTTFHPSLMIIDQYYPFDFKNRKYLLKKTNENIIDIYEIKE